MVHFTESIEMRITFSNAFLVASLTALSFWLAACLQRGRINVTESVPMKQHPGAFSSPELFEGPVKSVLEHRCIHCHNNARGDGGLNLQNRELVFAGGSGGPFIVPGKPDQSKIWNVLLLPEKNHKMMPADGWGLTLYEMQSFRAWIKAGADWPKGQKGKLQLKPFSFEETVPL